MFQMEIFTLTSYSLAMNHWKKDIYNMQWKNYGFHRTTDLVLRKRTE